MVPLSLSLGDFECGKFTGPVLFHFQLSVFGCSDTRNPPKKLTYAESKGALPLEEDTQVSWKGKVFWDGFRFFQHNLHVDSLSLSLSLSPIFGGPGDRLVEKNKKRGSARVLGYKIKCLPQAVFKQDPRKKEEVPHSVVP